MAPANFDGLRVLSLESRRSNEMAKLIRTYGGEPFVVPAMREVPLESNRLALEFADRLVAGRFDLVVFLTGVGVRALMSIVETTGRTDEFLAALKKVRVAARGPKPVAVLKELKVPIAVVAPEPNTWREMIASLDAEFGDSLSSFRVAVQEYGVSNPELLQALSERVAHVVCVETGYGRTSAFATQRLCHLPLVPFLYFEGWTPASCRNMVLAWVVRRKVGPSIRKMVENRA